MRNFLFHCLNILVICSICNAGLPPTTSKISGDSVDTTTFKYRFPSFQGTHTGTLLSVSGVNDPVSPQDFASKAYVDSQLAQLNPAASVYAASTVNIAGTYLNVVPGVCIGDTFTTTSTTSPFVIDTATPTVGSRVLFKNQTSSFQNGVWVLTTQAVAGVSGAIFTRALDYDSSTDFNSGQIIPVVNGTQAGSSWFQTAVVTTCSSDSQSYTKFQNAASAYLLSASNLSDVANAATSFANITQPATASTQGSVSTTTQTFAGDKTFNGKLVLPTASTTALTLNTTGFVFDSTNNALGLGTAPATTTFMDGVNSTGAAKRLVLTGYGTGSTVGFRGRFARGASPSPSPAQVNDVLNFMSGQGYGATQFPAASTGAINFIAGETFTNSSNQTHIAFQTTPTGSVTLAEGMRLTGAGNLLIGTTTDSGTQKLQVNGNSNVGTVTNGTWNGVGNYYFSWLTSGTSGNLPTAISANTTCKFTVIGGGGAGGGNGTIANQHGGGGGAGGVTIKSLSSLASNQSFTYVIGGGGTPGANTDGGDGGSTTLTINATVYTGSGGTGGKKAPAGLGGSGGTALSATIPITGQSGQAGAATNANTLSGNGGSGPYGFGGFGVGSPATTETDGVSGVGFGSGGSGSSSGNASGSNGTGGNGKQGGILIECIN